MKYLKFFNISIPIIYIILELILYPQDYLYLLLVFVLLLPFIALFLTGISDISNTNKRLSLTINIINILLSIIVIYLIILIYSKRYLFYLISYSIVIIMSIINVCYFKKQLTNKEEYKEIKRIKEQNKGVIK